MQLGMIGLGRMGANMVRRLQRAGHPCVVYDLNAASVAELQGEGATGTTSMEDFVGALDTPRLVWLMLPAAVVDGTLAQLEPLLEPGDIVVDGGNSYYHDDLQRAVMLKGRGVNYVDVGVSGGVWGLERGYCLMIGGEPEVVARLDPIFAALAPGIDAAPRTPGRDGVTGTAEQGYLHCGPNGAGAGEGDREAHRHQWHGVRHQVAEAGVQEGRGDDADQAVVVARLDAVAVEAVVGHGVHDLRQPHEADDRRQHPKAVQAGAARGGAGVHPTDSRQRGRLLYRGAGTRRSAPRPRGFNTWPS